jgi:hypothetical protein
MKKNCARSSASSKMKSTSDPEDYSNQIRTLGRINSFLNSHNSIIQKRKEHTFKCRTQITEMEKSIEEGKTHQKNLNKKLKLLSNKFSELLGKQIGRKVVLTGLGI